jgi:hypothetical protein
MTSCLLDTVNAVIGAVGAIPYEWEDDALTDRNRKDNLFQLVSMWNDQVAREASGKNYSFAKPACFIELRNMGNDLLGSGISMHEPIFRLHIVDRMLDAGDEAGLDENLNVIHYRDAAKQAIAGFQPPNCSTLFTVNEEQDSQHDSVYHYILDFKCCFIDTKGTGLDPDQTTYIESTPPTNLELDSGFVDPGSSTPTDPLTSYIWKVCAVAAVIVASPDPTVTQTLDNGAMIPLQYALNNDGTLTIPYLTTTPGISILTPFVVDNNAIQDEPYNPATGTFDNSAYGGFVIGNIITFNASLPLS